MHNGTGVPLASHAPHVASTYSRPGGAMIAMRGLSDPDADELVSFALLWRPIQYSKWESIFVSALYEHH